MVFAGVEHLQECGHPAAPHPPSHAGCLLLPSASLLFSLVSNNPAPTCGLHSPTSRDLLGPAVLGWAVPPCGSSLFLNPAGALLTWALAPVLSGSIAECPTARTLTLSPPQPHVTLEPTCLLRLSGSQLSTRVTGQ